MTTKKMKKNMAVYKDGQYFYAPHRSHWGVWQWHESAIARGGHGEFIQDFSTREKAREEVYKLNNWNQ